MLNKIVYKRQKQHLLNLFAASHRQKKSKKSSTSNGQTLLCLHFDWSCHPSCVVQLNVNSGTRNSRFPQDFSSHYHRRRHSTFLVLKVPIVHLNKGDFCLHMLELFPGFSGFRSFHRTNKYGQQSFEGELSFNRSSVSQEKDINIKTNST